VTLNLRATADAIIAVTGNNLVRECFAPLMAKLEMERKKKARPTKERGEAWRGRGILLSVKLPLQFKEKSSRACLSFGFMQVERLGLFASLPRFSFNFCNLTVCLAGTGNSPPIVIAR